MTTILYILGAFIYLGIGLGVGVASEDDPSRASMVIVLLWPVVIIAVPVAWVLKKLEGNP